MSAAPGRYARLEAIDWWDAPRVAGAGALVVGAGALGNEVLKSLALVGWGLVVVVDPDRIETSNLTRSVLFTSADVGRSKALTAAARARALNPDTTALGIDADVRTGVGAGLAARMDVVLSCVDNLAARIAVGQLTGAGGGLVIDGGMTTWEGAVRLYPGGDGPCCVCGLAEDDFTDLVLRRSCLAYARRAAEAVGVPTTPTVASATAALMVQQALKWLHRGHHDLNIAVGAELRLDLAHDRFYRSALPRNPQCRLHQADEVEHAEITELSWEHSWADILRYWGGRLGSADLAMEFPVHVLTTAECTACGHVGEVYRLHQRDVPVTCAACGGAAVPELTRTVSATDSWVGRTPRQTGFPPWSWITATGGGQRRTFELTGGLEGLPSSWEGSR